MCASPSIVQCPHIHNTLQNYKSHSLSPQLQCSQLQIAFVSGSSKLQIVFSFILSSRIRVTIVGMLLLRLRPCPLSTPKVQYCDLGVTHVAVRLQYSDLKSFGVVPATARSVQHTFAAQSDF